MTKYLIPFILISGKGPEEFAEFQNFQQENPRNGYINKIFEEKDLLALFDSRMPRIRELATAYFGELETAFATKWGQNLDGRLADPDARSYFCSGAEWLLSRDSSMYSDPIHWNDEGQGVIARELCNVLVDRLAWIKQ